MTPLLVNACDDLGSRCSARGPPKRSALISASSGSSMRGAVHRFIDGVARENGPLGEYLLLGSALLLRSAPEPQEPQRVGDRQLTAESPYNSEWNDAQRVLHNYLCIVEVEC